MSDESIWEETFNILRQILGLEKRKPLKPQPSKPMTPDEVDQFGAQYQNYLVNQQIGLPGAMVLDAPLSRPRSEEEMMRDFERTGVTQRPGVTIKSSDVPRGALTTRAIGKKR
jgi:hypothetical protein